MVVGNAVNVDTVNTVIYSSGKMIAAVDVSDLVIVETPDAILVCPKSKAQDVRKIVDELEAEGREELL